MQRTSISQRVLSILSGIWLIIIFPFAASAAQIMGQLSQKGFPENLYATTLGWLFLPGPNITITLIFFISLLTLTIITTINVLKETYSKSNRLLRKHIRDMYNKNQGLSPQGFAQQSQALLSVNVPLDTIFIHLNATPDRPIYDLPFEQQKQLDALRLRTDLAPDELERSIQDLRRVWHSQFGPYEELARQQSKESEVEDILKYLNPELPVAVILGAPGSGKSTTLRWFTFQMARACLLPWHRRWLNASIRLLSRLPRVSLPSSWNTDLPSDLAPVQIPVLLRISQYAARLSKDEHLTIEQYFKELYGPELAEQLLHKIEQGHCLMLFDGLDEVASDNLRLKVGEAIFTFINANSSNKPQRGGTYTRFIVTSRIVGYEPGHLNKYAHYTLLDLNDEQIEQFLTNWCPAVERYQAMAAQGMKPLTAQQEEQVSNAGQEQRNKLQSALNNNPGIKRLAVNPLMLTILALIQRSGKTLPHRRIDLYEVVARTLLDNWNQESGRKVIPHGEISLAERLLSNLAYTMHTNDALITEPDVKRITCEVMSEFYPQPATDADAQQFIDTLRSSSGLFVEIGQGLFSFMHRTFQEYYTTLYLLDKQHFSSEDLKHFVATKYCLPLWREPLLLTIAYKSGQRDRDEQQQASMLIQTILDTRDEFDDILQRSLLFAANSIVDCTAWSVTPALQQKIAHALFDLYGDIYGAGRYRELQKDIERVALLWLRGQPEGSSQHTTWPPLLDAWRSALCDDKNEIRQQGAAHLITLLAPDIAECPSCVLNALLPPLCKLAKLDELSEFPIPSEVKRQMDCITAISSTPLIEEYAIVALRLFDDAGPAGWLHTAWQKWDQEQPAYLTHLTRHSLELNFLLTPAALPYADSDLNRDQLLTLKQRWEQSGQRNPRKLQQQLLHGSSVACFIYAYLYYKILKQELQSGSSGVNWQQIWDHFLRTEMACQRSTTYQACLHLRLIMATDSEHRNRIASELLTELSLSDELNLQTVVFINNSFSGFLRIFASFGNSMNLDIFRIFRDLRNLRIFRDLRDLRHIIDLTDFMYFWDFKDSRQFRDIMNIRDRESITTILCDHLKNQGPSYSHTQILLALYNLGSYKETLPEATRQNILDSVQTFTEQQRQKGILSFEHSKLINTIKNHIHPSVQPQQKDEQSPEERITKLQLYNQQQELTAAEVKEILQACTDKRKFPEELFPDIKYGNRVNGVAWQLLGKPIDKKKEVIEVLLRALDDQESIICLAATLFLKNNRKRLSNEARKQATIKIAEILRDDTLSKRPVEAPQPGIERVDEVLFDTLRVLVE